MSKFLKLRQSDVPFKFDQFEGIIDPIVDVHPELVMDDNSIIVFPNSKSYYSFVSNALLYTPIDNEVDIENLIDYYDNECYFPEEEISYEGNNISIIFVIEFEGDKIYYVLRDGENSLATAMEICATAYASVIDSD